MGSVKLGIIMDPIEGIDIRKDSSFAMLLEAQRREWEIHYMLQSDLLLQDNQVTGRLRRLSVQDDSSHWFELSDPTILPLSDLDAVLMRKDPPFNMEFIYTTHLLELAEKHGGLVINRPSSLRDCNEKLFTAWFPECCAPTLVSRQSQDFVTFLDAQRHIVIKPLDGMGGHAIFSIKAGDSNRNVIIETLTDSGQRFAMAQRFLPEIKYGDKRILMINGVPIDYALARIPDENDSRGNLATGAHAQGVPLTARDRWLCRQIAPELKARGLMFVGLDVIGDYITEINVTSPTCIRELDHIYNLNISSLLMNAIETRINL